MASIAFVAVALASGFWCLWELVANGIYRGGFFNYRIVWGTLVWVFVGFLALFWLQNSN